MREYFLSSQFYRYVGSNLVFLGFLQNSLPGVFEDNIVDYVNGPLWTIKIEVMFYVCVPLFAFLANRTHRLGLFAAIYVASLAWKLGFEHLHLTTERNAYEVLAKQLPSQMCFFIAGGALHYYHDEFMRYRHQLFVAAVLVMVLHFNVGLTPAYPAALAVSVIYFATRVAYLGNVSKFGDFSYGLYIYHYPILQIVAAIGLFESTPWLAFATAFLLAIVASYLSWHLIERSALLTSSHYVQASASRQLRETDPSRTPLALDQNRWNLPFAFETSLQSQVRRKSFWSIKGLPRNCWTEQQENLASRARFKYESSPDMLALQPLTKEDQLRWARY